MAGKTGDASKQIRHKAARGRELSGSHDHRQLSGKELLRSQEHPPLTMPRRATLPEQLRHSGKERSGSREHRQFPNYELSKGSSCNRYSTTQDLSRSGQHLFASKYLSKSLEKPHFLVQDNSRYKKQLRFSGHEHSSKGNKKEQESHRSTQADSRSMERLRSSARELSRSHGQHGFSSKQLSRSQEQTEYSIHQVVSRSQRHLPVFFWPPGGNF